MQIIVIPTSSQNKLVTTTEEPEPISGGKKLAIISCTLPLPTKLVEILVLVVNTHVEALEKLVTQKLIPLIIPKIGIGIKVTLIDNIACVSKVFRTLDIILKDTPIIKGTKFQLVPSLEFIGTTGKQPIDDLTTNVKQIVIGG
jgi:hypothetical protein